MASPVESTETYEQDTVSYDWLANDWDSISPDGMYRNVQGTYSVSLLPQGFYGVQLRQVLSELSGNQKSIVVLPVGGGPEIEEVFIEPGPGQFRRSPLPTGRLEFNINQLGQQYVIKYVSSGTLTGKGYIQNLIDSNSDVLALVKSFYLNWDQRTSAARAELRGIAYGVSSLGVFMFFIVSADGGDQVTVSRDGGLTWVNETTSTGSLDWNSISYNNELFVAVGNGATSGGGDTLSAIMTTDGSGVPATWTARTAPSKRNWKGIVFGEGMFLAVGYSVSADTATVMTSADGLTWTPQTAIAGNWESVSYGSGLFVAVQTSGANRVMTSLDGITWFARTVPLKSWKAVAFGNGFFVAVSNDASPGTQFVMRSDDGINWTLITTIEANSSNCSIAFGNDVFVIGLEGGSSLYSYLVSSDSGLTWEPVLTDLAAWSAMGYGGGVFVSGSDVNGDVQISLRAAENG